jgi:hypothetical protein
MNDIIYTAEMLAMLRALTHTLDVPALGLYPTSNEFETLYVKNNEGSVLQTYSKTTQKITILPKEINTVTGYLHGIRIEEKTYDDDPKLKLNVILKANKKYVLVSGIDSTFSTTLLLALSSLTVKDIRQPITVVLKPGTKKNSTVLCKVFLKREPVWVTFDKSIDQVALAKQLIERFDFGNRQKQDSPLSKLQELVHYDTNNFTQFVLWLGLISEPYDSNKGVTVYLAIPEGSNDEISSEQTDAALAKIGKPDGSIDTQKLNLWKERFDADI